jgi:hypothetical protein
MNKSFKLKLLNRAKDEFTSLSKSTLRKARWFKFFDLFIKSVISIFGALVAYASDSTSGIPISNIKIFGIIITGLTAISSVFTFEKRSQSNMQVYTKCKSVIPEIEEKISNIEENTENIQISQQDIDDYLHKIFGDLANLSLASFTDSAYGKIATSQRGIN